MVAGGLSPEQNLLTLKLATMGAYDSMTYEPNEYGFYRVTSAPPTGISIAALEGEWINGGQYLVFHDCDLYEGEYVITEDGMITYEGKVYIEYREYSILDIVINYTILRTCIRNMLTTVSLPM